MSQINLSEADIQRWTGEASFSRGRSYSRQGAIIHARREGDTLKAQCYGSRPQPYRLEVTVGSEGIIGGYCSCPVGGGGRCKHAAALLLAWLDDPDVFTEVEDLGTGLARRTKEELIDLIQKMLARYPDLEMLLELPVPAKADSQQPLDPEVIRRQVSHAFNSAGDEWGAAYDVSLDLLNLVDLGDEYVQQQNYRDAVTVYDNIIRETLDSYSWFEDHEGYLHEVVNRSVSGLGECLEATADPALRETILRALFDTYQWDVEFGGIDMGYEATDIILAQATAAERETVVQWTEDALPAGDSWSDDYHRQIYGRFLLALQEDKLDDEAFINLCRQTGRLNELVERLLTLGRMEEAAAEARQAEDYPLLNLAPIFVAHDQGDLIEQIIRERLPSSQDSRLKTWLKDRLAERGDFDAALTLEKELFWERPTTNAYQKLREVAQGAGKWETLQDELLARLAEEDKYALLTQIHLIEDKIEQALETLPLSRAAYGWSGGYYEPLSIEVAKAAETDYPHKAIELYMARVNQLIDARGRGNYAQAAQHLKRVREVYQRLDESEAWQTLIGQLRSEYRRLPALQDEMTQAGL